jgi:chromosome segregation ATPase
MDTSSDYEGNIDRLKTTLQSLIEQMPNLLGEYQKDFINAEVNNKDEEFKLTLEKTKTHLQHINSNIFSISNEMDTIGEEIEENMKEINESIEILKKENTFLKEKAGILEQEHKGTDGMIQDYKWKYNYNYLWNFLMIVGIIIACFALNAVFTK